jgi:hypothetical protein
MLRRLIVAMLALSTACGSSDGGTGPVGAASVEGTWTFFETLANAARTVRCDDEGRFDFVQDEGQVSGEGGQTGTCIGPDGPVDNYGSDSVRRVRLTENTIAFTFGGCEYQATLFASPPDSMAGTVRCSSAQGPTLTGTWLAGRGLDESPPSVSGVQVPPTGDTLFVPGDTFRLTVGAEDDRKLLWVGYRLGAPASLQDSARVVVKNGQASFELSLPIPAAWVGTTALVVFARDAFDRVTEQNSRALRVYDLVRRPLGSVALGTRAIDLEYDAKRDLIYLLEPQDGRIAVLHLADLSLGTPIPVPTNLPSSTGNGMDLSQSGDSLIVAISIPPALHVIDLVDGSTSDVPMEDPRIEGIRNVTVADGRAFVHGERREDLGYITGRLWEVDLATKAQEMRTDVGATGGGNIGLQTEFATSGDGSRLLLVDTPVPCMQVFTPETGFGPCATPPGSLIFLPTGSSDGSAWLVRHHLYDAGLAVAATPVPEDALAGVLAPDASVAYYPTPFGFQVIELSGGTVREHVRVPYPASRLTLLSEAGRIAVWTDGPYLTDVTLGLDRITVVDLQ